MLAYTPGMDKESQDLRLRKAGILWEVLMDLSVELTIDIVMADFSLPSTYMGSDWSQANLLSVIILIWFLFILLRSCSKKLLSKSWRSEDTFRIWLPLETLQVHGGIKRVGGGQFTHTQLSGCRTYYPDEMMNLMMGQNARENVYASEASKMLVGFSKVATC